MENENVKTITEHRLRSYMRDFGGYETHNIVADSNAKVRNRL